MYSDNVRVNKKMHSSYFFLNNSRCVSVQCKESFVQSELYNNSRSIDFDINGTETERYVKNASFTILISTLDSFQIGIL